MKKLLFVPLALAMALATSPAAKADSVYYFNFTGTCSAGTAGCDSQSTGGTVSITATGSFTVTGSGSTYTITGASATIDGINATLLTPTTAGVVATSGGYYYQLDKEANNLLTAPGYYGYDQSIESGNSDGYNAVFFDNKFTPGKTQSFDSFGIDFLLDNGAIVEIFGDNGSLWWNEVIDGEWLIDPDFNSDANHEGADPLDLTISSTPEPSSLMFLSTGLLLMAGFLFRKAKPSMIQSA